MDDAARDRLVTNIVGQLLQGVTEAVLQRAFGYLRNVDRDLGDRVEKGVRAAATSPSPVPAEQGARRFRRPRPPERPGLLTADG